MKNWKNELPAALLAGGICGIVCLIGLLFITPERWYLSFVITLFMGAVVFIKSSSDKKKNSGKYERDEHLISFPWIFSAEGYIRESSDRDAKIYFGEEKIAVLSYKNVKPIINEYECSKVKTGYFDRCGWLSIVLEGEKMRLVIPKQNAEKASIYLDEITKRR